MTPTFRQNDISIKMNSRYLIAALLVVCAVVSVYGSRSYAPPVLTPKKCSLIRCIRSPCICPLKCPVLSCPKNCRRTGWVVGPDGCNTCQCKPRKCPPVCAIACPNGNVLDSNGCPTCRCKPAKCQPVLCKLGCPNGFAVDKDGCEICRCKPTVCLARLCKQRCLNGFQKDKWGCNTCSCNRPITPIWPVKPVKPVRPTFPVNPGCLGAICNVYCPNGYATHKNGCPTCGCRPGPAPKW